MQDRDAGAAGDAPTFLPEGAFVVQFKAGFTAQRSLAGRAEHVVSGQAAHFESPAELLAFLRHVLRAHLPQPQIPGKPRNAGQLNRHKRL